PGYRAPRLQGAPPVGIAVPPPGEDRRGGRALASGRGGAAGLSSRVAGTGRSRNPPAGLAGAGAGGPESGSRSAGRGGGGGPTGPGLLGAEGILHSAASAGRNRRQGPNGAMAPCGAQPRTPARRQRLGRRREVAARDPETVPRPRRGTEEPTNALAAAGESECGMSNKAFDSKWSAGTFSRSYLVQSARGGG